MHKHRLRIKELDKRRLHMHTEVRLHMHVKVRHQRLISIEVRLHMHVKVRHRLLTNTEVRLHMQDRVKPPKQDGMELVHNSGLQHQLQHRNLPDSEQKTPRKRGFFYLINIRQLLWRHRGKDYNFRTSKRTYKTYRL